MTKAFVNELSRDISDQKGYNRREDEVWTHLVGLILFDNMNVNIVKGFLFCF